MENIRKISLSVCFILIITATECYSQGENSLDMEKAKSEVSKKVKQEQDKIRRAKYNSDFLYENNTSFTVDKTPLIDLEGYKTVFPYSRSADVYTNYPRLFNYDKPYIPHWEIIEGELCLLDIEIYAFPFERELAPDELYHLVDKVLYERFNVYEDFEEFTGCKFINLEDKEYIMPSHPYLGKDKIMKASWVNGVYIVTNWGRGYAARYEWKNPIAREEITFKDGVVVSRKTLDLDVE